MRLLGGSLSATALRFVFVVAFSPLRLAAMKAKADS